MARVRISWSTGFKEGCDLLGGSCIIAPSGEIIALATTRQDEVVLARCDFDPSRPNEEHMCNFARHRQIDQYRPITETAGAVDMSDRRYSRKAAP